MAKILLEVIRTGTIVVDIDWSDFIEVKRIKEI